MNAVSWIASPYRRAPLWANAPLILLFALVISAASPNARANEPVRPRRVLLVHSFGSSAPPFTTHSTAFETTIKREMGTYVDLDEVSLDMARYAQPDMEEAFAEFLGKRTSQWQPDVVVPIGSPAGRFVAKFRDRLFPQTPVVYSGMDRRTLPEDVFSKNATFVGENFDLKGLVEDILQLDPNTKQIVVIFGASPLERYWTTAFQQAFEPFTPRVKFTWVNDLSFDQMLDLVSKLPPHSFVLLGLLMRDASGVTHNEDDALIRLRAVSSAPINGMFQHEVGQGIVGGRLYQGELEGTETARVASRILMGEPVSHIPPQFIGTGTPLYDWRELRRWKISEDRLPPGSVVTHRVATTWERYRWWVVGGLALTFLQGATIVGLVAQRRRRRRMQEALTESRELMELATRAGDLGLWSLDPITGEVWLNGPMRTLFGADNGAVVRFEDILARAHPDNRPGMVAQLDPTHKDDVPFEGEFRFQMRDGTERWLLGKGRSVVEPGGRVRKMGVILDITERKKAETELQHHRDELAHVSRVTTMGEMAASMAHELNQPLTAVLSNAQSALRFLARQPADIDEVRTILADIVADDKRASEIIQRMRSMVKKETPEFASLDLDETIREVVRLLHGDARHVRIILEIDPDIPRVRGIRVQVQQVLLNLMLNAIAAMKDLPSDRRTLVVRAASDGVKMVRVTVEDSGPGLSPELTETVFKPFFTTKRDGLGIGLSISRSIAEIHGGRLWAENNVGKPGVSFCFAIPAMSPDSEQSESISSQMGQLLQAAT